MLLVTFLSLHPNHFNQFPNNLSSIASPISTHIQSFCILFFLVWSKIHLNILIFTTTLLSQILTVSSAYQLLDRESSDENIDGVFQDVWKLKIPSKAAFFAWRLICDRLPTKSNLSRRNVDITDKLCPLRREKDEEAAHLFFSCHKVMPLWWECLS